MIDANIFFAIVEDIPARPGQCLVGIIGSWDLREDILHIRGGNRIEIRHLGALSRALSVRVVSCADGEWEGPTQLRLGWYLAAGERVVGDHSPPILGVEEESLVLPNWAVDGEAKIIPAQRRPLDLSEIIEIVIGLQNIVSKELIGAAMKGIGSGAGHDIDYAS